MLTIHHLGKSQSERIVWLCEELGLPYELKHYVRDPVTILSPPALRATPPGANSASRRLDARNGAFLEGEPDSAAGLVGAARRQLGRRRNELRARLGARRGH